MQTAKKQPETDKRQVIESAIQAKCSSSNISKRTTNIAIAKGLRLYDMGVSNGMSISEAMRTARKVQDAFNRGVLREMRG